MIYMMQYVLFKLFKFLVQTINPKIFKYFLDGLTLIVYLIDTKHRKIAMANLNLVFGDRFDNKRKNEIIKNSYKNFIYTFYEFCLSQTLKISDIENKITILNESILIDAIKTKRPIIFITGHYGNWELIGNIIPKKYIPFAVVGRMMNNYRLNNDLKKIRMTHGAVLLDRNGATKGLVQSMQNGYSIGLVIDQHINRQKGGVVVEFFGKSVLQTQTPAKLAIKFNAIIVPIFVIPRDFGKYDFKICSPISTESGSIQEITQLQSNIIQNQIEEIPDFWFWQHKRFKEFHNSIY